MTGDKKTEINDGISEDIVTDGEDLDISFDDISGDGQEKITKLKAKLRDALKEKEEYLLGWQRCRADFVNSKRMAEMDRLGLVESAGEAFVRDILPVLDSFEMALNMNKTEGGAESSDALVGSSWRAGFMGIYSKMIDILGRRGLKQIAKIGEKFNINEEEPVATVSVDKEEMDDIVTEVFQKGYMLNGKVIRPAKVAVGQYSKKV